MLEGLARGRQREAVNCELEDEGLALTDDAVGEGRLELVVS